MPSDLVIRIPMLMRGNEYIPFEWLEKVKQIEGVKDVVAIATDTQSQLVDYDFKKSDPEWYDYMRKQNIDFKNIEVSGVDLVEFSKIKKIKVVSGKSLQEPLKKW